MMLEAGIVPLVCERATEEDLAGLDDICQQSEAARAAGDYPVDLSLEFHLRVAQATHNPAITMMVKSFCEPLLMSQRQADGPRPVVTNPATHEHEQFTAAVRRRDARRAAEIMHEHLESKVLRVSA
jgi:GntR family transcriptional regulator, transcriptional repressor for pyruvate dehydrogenase complex